MHGAEGQRGKKNQKDERAGYEPVKILTVICKRARMSTAYWLLLRLDMTAIEGKRSDVRVPGPVNAMRFASGHPGHSTDSNGRNNPRSFLPRRRRGSVKLRVF